MSATDGFLIKKNEKIILETENTKHIKKGYFETKLVDLVFKKL